MNKQAEMENAEEVSKRLPLYYSSAAA